MNNISFTLKKWLLFFAGSSLEIVNRHHPQSRMITYTIGSLLLFVTIPVIFSISLSLWHLKLNGILDSRAMNLVAVILLAILTTTAILTLDRAILIFFDAIKGPYAFILLISIRIGMAWLFSDFVVPTASQQKYDSLIKQELSNMFIEAIDNEDLRKQIFRAEVKIKDNADSIKQRISTVESQLDDLPQTIVFAMEQLALCRNNLGEMQKAALVNSSMTRRHRRTEKECIDRERTINQAISDYRSPKETELVNLKRKLIDLNEELQLAEDNAQKESELQATDIKNTLTMNDASQRALIRVRTKYSDIDHEINVSTLLLAILELLPLMIKILLHNSPINAEAKAVLQMEAAEFRALYQKSLENEGIGIPSHDKDQQSRSARRSESN